MTGAELKVRREALGLTQDLMHDEMMDILGQPRSRFGASILSRWENDRVKLPVWMPLVVRIIEQA